MDVDVRVVNALAGDVSEGDPVGVVPHADGLSAADMQRLALDVGLDEIAFVSSSEVATAMLHFYSRSKQQAYRGNATVAAFSLLQREGRLTGDRFTMETDDGGIWTVLLDDGAVLLEQAPPLYVTQASTVLDPLLLREAVGLSGSAFAVDEAPMVVNTGAPVFLLPLRDEEALASATPDHRLIARISRALDLVGIYLFTTRAWHPDFAASTRMFAPHPAIDEEAGTLMAAGPLAAYLHDVRRVPLQRLRIEQGRFMPEPTPCVLEAHVRTVGDRVVGLAVGGRAVERQVPSAA